MKAKFLRLLLLSSFMIVGCNNPFQKKDKEPEEQQPSGDQGGGDQTPQKQYLKKKVTVKMEALLKGSETPYNVLFDYDDELFLKDAELYDKDLSLLSLGAAISGTYENWAKDFLRDCAFSDALSHQMDIEPTEDTLGYTLGHKTINDSELFAIMVRGHEYKKEWANNFIIGETGDHEGWLARTNELYTDLSNYVSQYKGEKTVKLWIVGYSRAGAISNMLASKLFRENFAVTAKNMYVYTFEAPAGLTEEHALEYANVHNIVNSADIVTYIPPTQYGFDRAGVDFEIYDADYGTYVTQFDSSITVQPWTPCDSTDFGGATITNDVELTQYLICDIFEEKSDDSISAHTRALYVQNYQSGLSYSIGMLLALTPATRSQMLSTLTGDIWTMLPIMADSTGAALANFMKTYLNQDNISYDNDQLTASCAVMIKAIQNLFNGLLGIYMDNDYKGNMSRILNMHYPEVTYVLLKNANSKLA